MNDNTCDDVPAKADAIKLSPFGSELDDTQCELLAGVMMNCAIKDRAFLIEEGQKDDCLHVLTCGNMEVVTRAGGGELVGLHILREGDIMGEMGFLDGVEHSASLRAMGNCELLRLERASLESLLDKDPDSRIQGDACHCPHRASHPAEHERPAGRVDQLHYQAARTLLSRLLVEFIRPILTNNWPRISLRSIRATS